MLDKEKFILLYLDDYVVMAYRKLINKVSKKDEEILISILHTLLDEYEEGDLNDYIHNHKIVTF